MNWSIGVYVTAILLITIGVSLLKVNTRWAWSLSRRAYLRNNMVSNFRNNKSSNNLKFIKNLHPVSAVINMIRKNREQKMDKEIFEAIIFLRNMAAIGKGKTTSTDFVIQKLTEHKGLLQPVYIKMLSLLRLNRKDEAVNFFFTKVNTVISKDFARLLIQWDEIDPSELTEILVSHEKSIKEIRITNQKRRDEIISDLIYFPVVLNVFIIFVNFIYVAYFINQRDMLQMFT